MKLSEQPWLAHPLKEIILIMAPAILPVAAVIIFQDYFAQQEVTSLWWVVLVLGIDVSHVYSTLFRLYWDKPTFVKYKKLLILIPALAFLLGFALHLYSSFVFWRLLAYVAAFHFVRQQYGFLRLYSRKEPYNKWHKLIDTVAIYNATLYPLLYWHFNLTDKLSWFIPGDFVRIEATWPTTWAFYLYVAIIVVYVIKEWRTSNGTFNIPKNLIMLGTYASWYVGIVAFQGDLIFTLLNVVAHGIPYMGLIWIYGEKKTATTSFSFTWKGVLIFLGVLLTFAYIEEHIWDSILWQDHADIFPFFANHPLKNPVILSASVSILILPQVTHYILDGFIWRFSKDKHAQMP